MLQWIVPGTENGTIARLLDIFVVTVPQCIVFGCILPHYSILLPKLLHYSSSFQIVWLRIVVCSFIFLTFQARPAAYAWSFALCITKASKSILYVLGGPDQYTSPLAPLIKLPVCVICPLYQVFDLLANVFAPSVLYYTMVQDTAYWNNLATAALHPNEEDGTRLIQSGESSSSL